MHGAQTLDGTDVHKATTSNANQREKRRKPKNERANGQREILRAERNAMRIHDLSCCKPCSGWQRETERGLREGNSTTALAMWRDGDERALGSFNPCSNGRNSTTESLPFLFLNVVFGLPAVHHEPCGEAARSVRLFGITPGPEPNPPQKPRKSRPETAKKDSEARPL